MSGDQHTLSNSDLITWHPKTLSFSYDSAKTGKKPNDYIWATESNQLLIIGNEPVITDANFLSVDQRLAEAVCLCTLQVGIFWRRVGEDDQ